MGTIHTWNGSKSPLAVLAFVWMDKMMVSNFGVKDGASTLSSPSSFYSTPFSSYPLPLPLFTFFLVHYIIGLLHGWLIGWCLHAGSGFLFICVWILHNSSMLDFTEIGWLHAVILVRVSHFFDIRFRWIHWLLPNILVIFSSIGFHDALVNSGVTTNTVG